ncbi:uncharacterized protein LOC126687650 [Mercurialis annua]|uniref:uncharacterized protein LOC126687650 n=1 Tax=Mercurialis annua TaxID=3986 RepID=UPI00215FF16E|nr:uncharacterized protein LOC126687650 [Mercurialis annua]
MTPPRSIHEVHKLNGRITALGRFMSCSAKRCLPFFKTLKQIKNFTWITECQTAFEELKKFLSSPPLLARPEKGDMLYLYISCSDETIAGVLVSEKEGEQFPIYYISKVLRDAELRYPKLEKLALCVYTATIKLRHYFEGHQAETSGRIAEWAIKIGSLGVTYEARKALKAQALADFFAELTFAEPIEDKTNPWEIHFDGTVCGEGAGISVMLKGPGKVQIEYSARLEYPVSNNVAEYEALLARLQLCEELNISEARIYSESQLVVNQIPRAMNGRADELAKWAATKNYESIKNIPHEIKRQPSFQEEIEEGEVLMIDGEETWMTPITAYLANGVLPEDRKDARKIKGPTTGLLLAQNKGTGDNTSEGMLAMSTARFGAEKTSIENEANRQCMALLPMGNGYLRTAPSGHRTGEIPSSGNRPLHKMDRGETPDKNHTTENKFGIPKVLITDHGKQFDSAKFKKFYAEYQIDLRILLAGLKKRLDEYQGRWVEELYSVLWNYRTTPRESTGETLFALAYGTEAVIPVEIGAPTPRTKDSKLYLEENEAELRNNLDLLVEKINKSDIRMEAYRHKMAKHFNNGVKKRIFKLGDLVMRKTEVKKGEAGSRKLQPN